MILHFNSIAQGWILNLGARGGLSERGPKISPFLWQYLVLKKRHLAPYLFTSIKKADPICFTCYREILFESKLNFSFCLGICFCVEVDFTL